MTANRTILALDAAGAACSAAVWRDGDLRGRGFEAMSRGQSERLLPMIQATLDQAKTGFAEIDRIAVTLGPGGFTGVRIGLATARGLSLALRRPLLGFSNFQVLAAAALARDPDPARAIAVLIDAKRSDLYVQAFDAALDPLMDAAALYPGDLDERLPARPLWLVGDGTEQAAAALRTAGRDFVVAQTPRLSDAADLARLAAKTAPPAPGSPRPRPLYLRPPDVTPPISKSPALTLSDPCRSRVGTRP